MRLRTRADDGWATIDVQLRRRYDLIPNLVADRAGLRHARAGAVRARHRGADAGDRGRRASTDQAHGRERRHRRARQAHGGRRGVPRAQGRPAASSRCRRSSSGTESKIAYARQFYNDQVRRLNTAIDTFPSNLVAKAVRVRAPGFFDIDDPVARAGRRSTSGGASRCTKQIAANKRKTVLLVVGAFVFFGLVGARLGYVFGTGPVGLVIALVVAAGALGQLLLLRRPARARVVAGARGERRGRAAAAQPGRGPRDRRGRAEAAHLRRARAAPNAFATGRDPEHASIAVTQGLLVDDEPGRARGRDRPRARARARPRHAARHDRRDRWSAPWC